ncbi:MAG: hypothetical protein JST39_06325 [Bacteroidetes bacterium]|nr:hypothetical protein [Bacteroidota bacterium]
MKKITVSVVAMLTVIATFAQHRQRRDSLSFGQLKPLIMRVPVLQGQSQPRIIMPHEPRICFNTEFDIKLAVGSRIAEQAMFINSTDGIVGYLPPSNDGLINIIMPEIPKFSFAIIGMKGNIYRYYNQKGKGDVIEHYVSTGNTQTFQYQPTGGVNTASPVPATALFRKTETGDYCNGNMRAQAYRTENSATTWFIYGDRFPEKLHPIKYLGSFGVGYFQTEEGLYLILEMRTGTMQCRVTDIQNIHDCFDPNPFVIAEEKFNTGAASNLQHERDRLARQEAQISGDCVNEKTALLNFRKQNQQQQEENLRKSKEGNTYQDATAQKAMLGMMDPLIMVQDGILSTKVSICGTEHHMATAPHDQKIQDAQKISCLNQQLSGLQNLESQMRALDRQYASQPARALSEKSKLYLHFQPQPCN